MFFKKNIRSYWSWQGNNLSWNYLYSIGGISIIFFILFLLWIFRFKIKKWWASHENNFFIFKKELYFWRTIGLIILALQILRMLVLSTYVRQWEIWLPIHLCRLHILIIALLLIAGKIKWIKFLAIIAFIGALFGVGLANLYINDSDFSGKAKNLTIQMLQNKQYSFYSLGPDTFIFQEFFFTHIMIATLPCFIWIVKNQKLTLKEFGKIKIGYLISLCTLWLFNWVASTIPDDSWKANAWYVGPDEQNDFKNALGWLSHWPQNLFSYSLIVGFPVMWLIYFLIVFLGNFVWFENKKILQMKKTKQWIQFKNSRKLLWMKIKNGFSKK